jgi:hypothetical protein
VFLGKSRKFLILRDFFYLYTLQPSHPLQSHAGNTTMSHQIFNRALKIVGFVALIAAFAVPAANAATAKNTIVKKQHASSKASASKKVIPRARAYVLLQVQNAEASFARPFPPNLRLVRLPVCTGAGSS